MFIENKVLNTKTVDVDTFLTWEFNDLKDNKNRSIEKLKSAILKSGFTSPIFVWDKYKNGVKYYVMDGTGRKMAIQSLLQDGHVLKEVPYVEIQADNFASALQIVLEMNSRHGKITKQSFIDFKGTMLVDYSTLEIDGISSDIEIPEDMTIDNASLYQDPIQKDFSMRISFKSKEDLENALVEIEQIAKNYKTNITVTGTDMKVQ